MKRDIHVLLLLLFCPASIPTRASDRYEPNESRPAASSPAPVQPGRGPAGAGTRPVRCDRPGGNSVTNHTLVLSNLTIHYRATAGYMPIEDASGKPLADIFFVAYEQVPQAGAAPAEDLTMPAGPIASIAPLHPMNASQEPDPAHRRPITFAFNGGPGASSVWLHMGALGPKRALLANNGTALPESDRLVDNEYTWLAFTDLVFVDPVGTGFSRPAPGVDAARFYEVQKDVETNAAFIRLFVTKYGRWLSPQFLVGESYGTTRAVAMARYLQERYALYIDGLILLSSALNVETISFDPGNDLPYVLSLPSCAAVAQYHGRLGDRRLLTLQKTLERVKTWALQDYISALARGRSLPSAQYEEVARKLAEYTGLSQDVITDNNLRISTPDFTQELLRRENKVLGLLDGRVTAETAPFRRRTWTDPSLFIVEGPFVATFQNYVGTDLGFRTDQPYVFLSDEANESWKWGSGRPGYLNVAPRLAEAMTLDNHLRVFVAAGYYDLTTPFLSQEYVFDHLNLPAGLSRNVVFKHYYAGHQIYTSTDALSQLTQDVRAFLAPPEAR
jgi:carboxypeptidase C (cathepsin A)